MTRPTLSRADALAHEICARLLDHERRGALGVRRGVCVDTPIYYGDHSPLTRDIVPLLHDYERIRVIESVESTCDNAPEERRASSRKRG